MNIRDNDAKAIRNIRKMLKGNPVEVDPSPNMVFSAGMLGMCILLAALMLIASCNATPAHAQELTASWYSIESLKKEGTWAYSHGRMANGHIFNDSGYTCATRLFPFGTTLRVQDSISKHSIIVKVTDRISKRFSKTRIDLSKKSFAAISRLNKGLIKVNVEVI